MGPNIITFQKMLPEYKSEILRISSKIWEGDDYLPYYFDKWIKDQKGEFTAIFYDEKLIGCAKLTFLTETDIWFEGLRKDPDCKVHGVAKELIRYYLNKVVALSRKQKITSVRFSTYIDNIASIKSNEKMGAKLVKSYYYRNLEFNKEQFINHFKFLKKFNKNNFFINDISKSPYNKKITETILSIIKKSKFMDYSYPFFPIGWKIYPFNENLIKEKFLNLNKIISFKNPEDGFLLYHFDNMGDKITIKIPFLISKEIISAKSLLFQLLNIIEKNINEQNPEKIKTIIFESMVSDDKFLIDTFNHLGFRKLSDKKDVLVYEYSLDMIY